MTSFYRSFRTHSPQYLKMLPLRLGLHVLYRVAVSNLFAGDVSTCGVDN